jgi:hypothetical protein
LAPAAGDIPGSLGNLAQLTHLDLFGNQLSGAFFGSRTRPATYFSLVFLPYFIPGRIPESLANLRKLTFMDLSGNQLSGRFLLFFIGRYSPTTCVPLKTTRGYWRHFLLSLNMTHGPSYFYIGAEESQAMLQRRLPLIGCRIYIAPQGCLS